EKSGLKLVNILDGNVASYEKRKEILDLPNILPPANCEVFIKAFSNAEFVITDSFHGTAFSIIFRKPFLSIINSGRGAERFYDLLGRLNLIDRLSTSSKNILRDEKFLKEIDYTETDKIIAAEKEKAINWLKNALEVPITTKAEEARNIPVAYNLCVGCGACTGVCPTNALYMKRDVNGYNCAEIDRSKCIDCGKCDNICPVKEEYKRDNNKNPKLYEFIANDEKILFDSSSGGIFTLIAEQFLNGDYVAGCAWNSDFTAAEHIMIDKLEDLPKLQKSKYMQSDVKNIFSEVKERLNNGKKVLFTGCPCQVAGLYKFLGKEYDNLFTIDLFCAQSPSPLFYQKYLEESFGGKQIEDYAFRYKKNPNNLWTHDCVTVTVTGEDMKVRNTSNDAFQQLYHKYIMMPVHCEKCKFCNTPRVGDISIGDFWWISKRDTELPENYKKGISAVVINNAKGQEMFDEIPEAVAYKKEVPLDYLGGNGRLFFNVGKRISPPERDLFYKIVMREPFLVVTEKCLRARDNRMKDAKIKELEGQVNMQNETLNKFKELAEGI
ncbi:MAG: Coenzyme F420 hydrogenase/dehydrogenase, beta subunit C-terminal domain, partial [Oscillospiraceae bacterium]|nr:Coenzyme F420 hydrogenase/dehydrogenase, beta subunit C-terminal domain [Oscillospiraceae bacterium]